MSPNILDLPIECLQKILQQTLPEGFESASLSCKAMHAASAYFIEGHNLRKRRFGNFLWSEARPEGKHKVDSTQPVPDEWWDKASQESGYIIPGPRELLEAIAEEPLVGRYIRTIKMADSSSMYYYYDDEDDEDYLYWTLPQTPISDRLREFVRASPDIAAVGGDPEVWIHAFDTGGAERDASGHCYVNEYDDDENFRLKWYESFLLTLLPNVTTIQLPEWWYYGFFSDEGEHYRREFMPLREHIVKRANDSSIPDASLSHLSVILPVKGHGYECKESLEIHALFNGIQSLRELYHGGVVALDDVYTGIEFNPTDHEWSRHIEIIELVGVVIGESELDRLLSLANKGSTLRVFHLGYEVKYHGCGLYWDAGALLAVVQRHCADSLEELMVTQISGSQDGGCCGSTLVDMTKFRKLKFIELDIEMLCGPAYDPENPVDLYNDCENLGDPAWPALVDLLPRSIQKVNIRVRSPMGDNTECITRLFMNFEAERSTKLPNLEEITLFVPDRIGMTGEKASMEARAAVEFAESETCRIMRSERVGDSPFVEGFAHRFGLY